MQTIVCAWCVGVGGGVTAHWFNRKVQAQRREVEEHSPSSRTIKQFISLETDQFKTLFVSEALTFLNKLVKNSF